MKYRAFLKNVKHNRDLVCNIYVYYLVKVHHVALYNPGMFLSQGHQEGSS